MKLSDYLYVTVSTAVIWGTFGAFVGFVCAPYLGGTPLRIVRFLTGTPINSHPVEPLIPPTDPASAELATTDPEIMAMIVCGAYLEPLSPDARRRVLRWTAAR